MKMNPMQMLKMFMGKMSPQEAVGKMVGNQNPVFGNLINMANNGKEEEVTNFARNFCKERGINFDKEFSNFMSNFR